MANRAKDGVVTCEGVGELDKAREPADRIRLKADISTKEREKFE